VFYYKGKGSAYEKKGYLMGRRESIFININGCFPYKKKLKKRGATRKKKVMKGNTKSPLSHIFFSMSKTIFI
jgi:hypothetical protein